MRRVKGLLGVIVGLMLLMHAGNTFAVASEHGNNGDIKIHEGATESEPVQANDPHVCTFHIHGFNFDASSSGTWSIEGQGGNAGSGTASGSWSANTSGEWRTSVMSLPPGHYKAAAKQMQPSTSGGEKQKVFWVECGSSTTTGGSTTTTGGTTTSGTTTAGTTTSGTTTAGTTTSGTTTSGTTTGGTTTAGTTTSGTTTSGTTAGTTTGGTTTGGTTTGGTTTAGTTTAGSTGGAGNVTGGETLLPQTGAQAATSSPNMQSGAQAAASSPSGVSPSVSNLPSTSTQSTGDTAPLAFLGALLMVAGAFLLRRPSDQLR